MGKCKCTKDIYHHDVLLASKGEIVEIVDRTLVNIARKTNCDDWTFIYDKIKSGALIELGNNSAHDNVNHPSHYTSGENGIECIDAMIAAYGKEAVMHFCQCNAFKYQWRFDKKNGVEDLKKAAWYNNKYAELKNE